MGDFRQGGGIDRDGMLALATPSSTLGVELGSYLPYLRIAYRMGSLNDVADLMSRYPLDLKEGEHSVASIPDDLFDVLASVKVNGKPAVYLCEPRDQKDIEKIWEAEAACSSAQLALLG
eukprot:4240568-Pleurochrysis_carterae.AAC.1